MTNYIHFSKSYDGYTNLAADGLFLDTLQKGDIMLYMYVNENAVIIGRNQNAWRECNLMSMERDGVQLVRRHTGGGAVFHDKGNLNFSFIMAEKDYDLQRQFKVVMNAMKKLGLEPELSGRNDILVEGKKFSGNAYALAKGNRAHHGTILVNTDLTRLSNYLNVSKAKLAAKGIESVQSRVCNLADFIPGLEVKRVAELLVESFIEEYGEAREYPMTDTVLSNIEYRRDQQISWEWRFGKTPECENFVEQRFSFGEMQMHFTIKNGRIAKLMLYSDSIDTTLVSRLTYVLKGCKFESNALREAFLKIDNKEVGREIVDFMENRGQLANPE
ncbi:MAG: lipoate--protein ligase [Clostridia bacterium]|nr:lipoate--protein ligase [Clostridia bacterium]